MANWPPVANRCRASLAIACATKWWTAGGTSAGSGGGTSRICMIATVTGLSATNGNRPARHSYATTPSEYTSLAALTLRPSACSGLKYCAVPTTIPLWVSGTVSATRAIPKSVIFTIPSCPTSRLPGFTSRCTMPARCAASSAVAACSITSSVRSVGSRPSRARIAESGSPSTNSITRYAVLVGGACGALTSTSP